MTEYGIDPRHDPGEPQIRLRIKHGRTARDGWVCQETTVELTAPLAEGAGAVTGLLEGYLAEVHLLGAREAKRRNQEETP